MTEANTLLLRLEGPLQAWGDTSKFVIRRTMEAPTKSGVLGLLCCAMGLSREKAREGLPELNGLAMGVRIDRPGTRWWDYQTVGAGIGLTTAGGGLKTGAKGTLIMRREYLADASFLVALQGNAKLIHDIAVAIASPKWPIFLGRKSCPPSVPVLERPREGESWTNPAGHDGLNAALAAIPWRLRYKVDATLQNGTVETLLEWRPVSTGDVAPDDAEVWYDVPVCFDPPVHEARFVLRGVVSPTVGEALQEPTPAMPRPRANYANSEYLKRRKERIQADAGLCVFCKSPGPRMTVQHVTYRRAGGGETMEDLRSLCGLCHDAVTMIEYGRGMGLDRINPEEPRWRDLIIKKRAEILKFRSLETRRRHLAGEEGN